MNLLFQRRLMLALGVLKKFIVTSANRFVSFFTNVEKPLKVTCEFTPIQDLHGQNKPYPPGGGANKFDANTLMVGKTYYLDGSIVDEASRSATDKIAVNSDSPVYVSYVATGTNPRIVFCQWDEQGNLLSRIASITDNPYMVTLNSECTHISVSFYAGEATYNTSDWSNYMISQTQSSYVPYSNICPIDGWTECSVSQFKKNLFPSASGGSSVISLKAGDIITASCTATSSPYFRMTYADGTQSSIQWMTKNSALNRYVKTITLSKDVKSAFFFLSTGVTECQVELGSTPTPYEEYQQPDTRVISWAEYSFEPIQEGTGDPSPTNIRHIIPGLSITRDDGTALKVYGGKLIVHNDGTSTVVGDRVGGNLREIYRTYIQGRTAFSNNTGINFQVGTRGGGWSCYAPGSKVSATMCSIFKYTSSNLINTYNFDYILNGQAGRLRLKTEYSEELYNMAESDVIDYIDGLGFELVYYPSTRANNVTLIKTFTYELSEAETERALSYLGQDSKTIYGGTVTINEDGSADIIAKWFGGVPNFSKLASKTYINNGYVNAYDYFGKGALIGFPVAKNKSLEHFLCNLTTDHNGS